jgi:hypothetical protein
MEVLGWICTVLILIGYFLNSSQQLKHAILVWCIGDIGWIIYDMSINNVSHAVLSGIIILLNIYGLYKISKKTI